MKRDQVINQLKDLYYNLKNFQEIESKEEGVKALEYAIKELEKAAPEVPVQEQTKPKCTIDFGSGKFRTIKLYNNQEDFAEKYNASNENLGLILTPDILRFSKISSIDEIFMIGFLEDK